MKNSIEKWKREMEEARERWNSLKENKRKRKEGKFRKSDGKLVGKGRKIENEGKGNLKLTEGKSINGKFKVEERETKENCELGKVKEK